MMGLSRRKYAQHHGCSHTAVGKAIAEGRISTLPDGTIDPAVADREWDENTNKEKQANGWKGATRGAPPPPSHPAPAAPTPRAAPRQAAPATPPPPAAKAAAFGAEAPASQDPVQKVNLNAAITMKEAYNAKIRQTEYEEKIGKLVDGDQVKVDAFNAARAARDALFGIPDRIASTLVGLPEIEIYALLAKEVRLVAEGIAAGARE